MLGRFHELRQQGQQEQQAAGAAAGPGGAASASAGKRPTPGAAAREAATGLQPTLKAAVAVSLLLLVKCYLRVAYDVAADRLAK